MEDEKFLTFARKELKGGYVQVFMNPWPMWVGSICISIIALFIFLWKTPWGIAGGYLNIGGWFFFLMGVMETEPTVPWLHPIALSASGLFVGALASSLMCREFKIRNASGVEYLKGFIGGSLMGAGAALSGGCNVGGFFTAIAMFSIGGYLMWCGLIAGAFIGLRILIWEINKFPPKHDSSVPEVTAPKNNTKWVQAKQYVGGFIIISTIVGFYLVSRLDQASSAGLCFMGLLMGITMHRSRFCFAGAFRDPFMTGEYRTVKAVILSLIIYCFGVAVIKWNYIQPYEMGVHHVWIGSLIGGVLFGIGMLLAGGCASSTLWRMAEGHTKYVVTAISFSLVNSIASLALKKTRILDGFGKGVFLPETIGWGTTLPLVLVFSILWLLIAVWNEKTDKFVI